MRPVLTLYSAVPVREFGPLKLIAARALLVKGFTDWNGKQIAPASRGVINHRIRRLKHIFRWGVEQQLISTEASHAIDAVRPLMRGRTEARETEPVGPVPDELVERTLPFMPSVVADMVRLQRLTGARPSEICELRPGDIDRSGEVWCYVPRSHKTEHHGRGRTIFMGVRAQAILLPYLLRNAEAFCFSPSESERKRAEALREARKSPVQPSQWNRRKRRPKKKPGERYTRDSYRRAIHRACDAADRQAHDDGEQLPAETRIVPRWSPHRLRHSAATEIRRRFGLEAAQVCLGHSVLTCRRSMQSGTRSWQRKSRRRLDSALCGKSTTAMRLSYCCAKTRNAGHDALAVGLLVEKLLAPRETRAPASRSRGYHRCLANPWGSAASAMRRQAAAAQLPKSGTLPST